jgi:hypothetical protein
MKNKMTDTQQIANFIDTLGDIRKAEGQVTETLKTVATNSKFKGTFLKAMNKQLTTLENEELKEFKGRVHKMQKLLAKKKTQETILTARDNAEPETHQYTIRLVNDKDITGPGPYVEADRGKLREFCVVKPEPEAKREKTLLEVIGDWQEKALGDDSTMSKDDYEGQLHDAKAHLLLETATIPYKKPEDRK